MKRIIVASLSNEYKKLTDGFDKHKFTSEVERYENDVTTAINNIDKHNLVTQSMIDDLTSISPDAIKKSLFTNVPSDAIRACYNYAAFAYTILRYCGYEPFIIIGCAYDTNRPSFKNTYDVPNHVWVELDGNIYENFTGVTHIDYRKTIEKFQY